MFPPSVVYCPRWRLGVSVRFRSIVHESVLQEPRVLFFGQAFLIVTLTNQIKWLRLSTPEGCNVYSPESTQFPLALFEGAVINLTGTARSFRSFERRTDFSRGA